MPDPTPAEAAKRQNACACQIVAKLIGHGYVADGVHTVLTSEIATLIAHHTRLAEALERADDRLRTIGELIIERDRLRATMEAVGRCLDAHVDSQLGRCATAIQDALKPTEPPE